MDDFLELKMGDAFVLTGAGLAMSIDSAGESFYVLHLTGFLGSAEKESQINVIIPPVANERFLAVVKAMEAKRE